MKRILLVLLLLTACDRDEIDVYTVPKGTALSKLTPFLGKVDGPALDWVTPQGWVEIKPEGMRSASFQIEDNNQEVDVSAIYLSGMAGGLLSNVNRWREQVKLPPWSEQELQQSQTSLKTSIGDAILVQFTGEETIATAIVPYGQGTWFFKMMGDKALIEQNRQKFKQWLQTLKVNQ